MPAEKVMTYKECLEKIKSEHTDLYPIWYIESGGKYLFNMLKRGEDKNTSMVNFFVMDPHTGLSIGPVPPLQIYTNPQLASKVQKPHMIPGEDQRLEHGFPKN